MKLENPKDCAQALIEIGDMVAYGSCNSVSLFTGKVTHFTAQKVAIVGDRNSKVTKYPCEVAVIKKFVKEQDITCI